MAETKKLDNGKIIIKCPMCHQWKHVLEFVLSHEKGKTEWHDRCEKCRKDQWVKENVAKPDDKTWDDPAGTCAKCNGSGDYYGFNAAGQRVRRGHCYRCKGKGHQTYRDMARNVAYDEWSAYKLVMGDMKIPEDERLDEPPTKEEVKEQPEKNESSPMDLGVEIGTSF